MAVYCSSKGICNLGFVHKLLEMASWAVWWFKGKFIHVAEFWHGKWPETTICILFAHTHTHTRLTALCPGLPGWAGTRKVKPIWILLKQDTVSGSGISWAICKSAPRSRLITTPAPHHSVLQAGCPSCRPTNSVRALKGNVYYLHSILFFYFLFCVHHCRALTIE